MLLVELRKPYRFCTVFHTMTIHLFRGSTFPDLEFQKANRLEIGFEFLSKFRKLVLSVCRSFAKLSNIRNSKNDFSSNQVIGEVVSTFRQNSLLGNNIEWIINACRLIDFKQRGVDTWFVGFPPISEEGFFPFRRLGGIPSWM